MTKNKGRILTVVVELTGSEADWLWDAHLNGPINGVKVLALGDGNEFDRTDELEKELEKANKHSEERYSIDGQYD